MKRHQVTLGKLGVSIFAINIIVMFAEAPCQLTLEPAQSAYIPLFTVLLCTRIHRAFSICDTQVLSLKITFGFPPLPNHCQS